MSDVGLNDGSPTGTLGDDGKHDGGEDKRDDGTAKVPTEAQIRDALRPIQDPEIHLGILDLGLIYGVQSDSNGTVNVRMTLTSPACPVGPLLQAQVHSAVLKLPGVKEAKVELVWTPPWDPRTMASDDIKMELGLL